MLLIACANVANLLLARAAGAAARDRASALALGAGRGRIVRQLLTESVLLSLAGGALGVLLAQWGARSRDGHDPDRDAVLDEVVIDPAVLGYTLAIARRIADSLFGLAPALHVSSSQLTESLKDGGQQASGGRTRNRLRGALVVAEIALTLVLLVGSGLMVRSFMRCSRRGTACAPRAS